MGLQTASWTMTFKPIFTTTHTITNALTKIERARGFLEAAKLSDDWVRTMQHEALVQEAHSTTHIEGTQLTLEQSERLLAGEKVPEALPDDKQELLNYRDAFELVTDYINKGGPVTEGLVREIHKRLVQGVRGNAADPGQYRKVPNYVVNSVTKEVIYTPPPANEVPHLMSELVRWINRSDDLNPVLLSGLAQFQLVHIHPFLDGNGRSARLLSTLCLYQFGYDFKRLFTISEYYDRDRGQYYKSLQSVRDNDMDMTSWLEYFVVGLATQMQEVKVKGEITIKQDLILSFSRSKQGLKSRHRSVLRYLFKKKKATISECEIALSINRRTLQRDFKLLVEEGLIREIASSPTDPAKYYEPSYDKL